MITKRQGEILRFLIKEFNKNQKPVSSQSLSKIIKLSPSMLRYELQELERKGYIEKSTHSSGRVPTHKGYKFIIDASNDMVEAALDSPELSKIFTKIEELFQQRNNSIDEILNESFQIISEFTKTITLTEKKYDQVFLQDIKIYKIDNMRLNLVFIFSNGEIFNKLLNSNNSEEDVIDSLDLLSRKLINLPVKEIESHLQEIIFSLDSSLKQLEFSFFEIVKNILERFISTSSQINSDINSLVNIFETKEEIKIFKNLIYKLETESIWKIINETKKITTNNTSVFLELENEFQSNSLVKKDFDIYGNQKTFFLFGNRNQNYDEILKLLNFIENKIKEIT